MVSVSFPNLREFSGKCGPMIIEGNISITLRYAVSNK